MKKFSCFLVAIALAATTLFALAGSNESSGLKAEALSPSFIPPYVQDVYYFSDSDPIFEEELDATNLDVVYDVHQLISSCELEYLAFTGYFWGFNQNDNLLFILQLSTSKVSPVVVETILYCVKQQGAHTLLITPYTEDYTECYSADDVLDCSFDKYAKYLRNVVNGIMMESGHSDLSFFTLFIDGRMVGLDDATQPYNLVELCKNSPTLRRLFLQIFSTNDQTADYTHEDDLYLELWDVYNTAFLNQLSYDFDAMSHSNIDDFIDMWSELDTTSESSINAAQENFDEACGAVYDFIYASYYLPRIAQIRLDHSHMFAHISNNSYVDLTSVSFSNINAVGTYNPSDLDYYTFNNFLDVIAPGGLNADYSYLGQHLFAMSLWYMPQAYYNFASNLQENWAATSMPVNEITPTLPVYIWEIDPIIDSDTGLIVLLSEHMDYLYGDIEEEEYDIDDIVDVFIAILVKYFDV